MSKPVTADECNGKYYVEAWQEIKFEKSHE
jgi:hypothetical protein